MGWGDARARRQERKQEVRTARIEGRTTRQASRQATTAEMAKAGMRRGQLVADVVGQGINAARDVMSGPEGNGKSKTNDDNGGGNAMLLPALAIGAYFLMRKKK